MGVNNEKRVLGYMLGQFVQQEPSQIVVLIVQASVLNHVRTCAAHEAEDDILQLMASSFGTLRLAIVENVGAWGSDLGCFLPGFKA